MGAGLPGAVGAPQQGAQIAGALGGGGLARVQQRAERWLNTSMPPKKNILSLIMRPLTVPPY